MRPESCELAVHHSAGRTEDRVHVGVLSPVTVVPLAEFEESTAEAVYQFVFNGRRAPKAKRRVFYDMLPSSNGVLLFALDEGHCAEVVVAMDGRAQADGAPAPCVHTLPHHTN